MNPLAAAAGLLIASGPFAVILAFWVENFASPPGLRFALTIVAALSLTTGGTTLARRPIVGRGLASLGVVGLLAVTQALWLHRPSAAFPILLSAAALLSHLWIFPGLLRTSNRQERVKTLRAAPAVRARSVSIGALVAWALYVAGGSKPAPAWPVLLSFALSGWFAWSLLRTAGAGARWRRLCLIASVVISTLAIAVAFNEALALTVSACVPLAALLLVPAKASSGMGGVDWWDPIFEQPARLLVSTFFALCVLGTLVLALPVASSGDVGFGLSDAAFTAVSAVCVTGLVVLDTGADFSATGQMMVLVLIQLGGLGIMTFSTAALRLLGKRLSIRHEAAMAELMTAQDKSRLFGSLRLLITFTFVAEFLGGTVLTGLFALRGDSLQTAAWRGFFTAISAFCNAGFALQANSLIPYQTDALVLYTIGILIVLGGLSPAVAHAFPDWVRRKKRNVVTAQVRLVVVATAMLIGLGAIWYAAVEWNNTLRTLSFADKLHNALFQSISLRTAGFNSVDVSHVREATLPMMLVLMFIGGSPGGTAGGVKTTTIAVLALAVIATVRGRDFILVFGKHIPHRTVFRAAAVVTVAGLGVLGGVCLMQLTQNVPSDWALFETVSALGTVGLSLGATPELDGIGRFVIILCMFVGRVGTLTLFMLLGTTHRHDEWRRPSEDLEVG